MPDRVLPNRNDLNAAFERFLFVPGYNEHLLDARAFTGLQKRGDFTPPRLRIRKRPRNLNQLLLVGDFVGCIARFKTKLSRFGILKGPNLA